MLEQNKKHPIMILYKSKEGGEGVAHYDPLYDSYIDYKTGYICKREEYLNLKKESPREK